MELRKGSRVLCPAGRGTVTDRDQACSESLVQLDEGTTLDTSHGRWWADELLAVVGFDPDALVWYAFPRLAKVPAGNLLREV